MERSDQLTISNTKAGPFTEAEERVYDVSSSSSRRLQGEIPEAGRERLTRYEPTTSFCSQRPSESHRGCRVAQQGHRYAFDSRVKEVERDGEIEFNEMMMRVPNWLSLAHSERDSHNRGEERMSLFSQDTLRPPTLRSNLQPEQRPQSTTASLDQRQRASSFSENLAQRVLGGGGGGSSTPSTTNGGGLSANSSFRRRSSGGGGGTHSSIGRRDSQTTTTTNAASSFLRSPILGGSNSGGGGGIALNSSASSSNLGGLVPTLKTLDSYNARNVAAALDQGLDQGRMIDDVWQSVCVKVLPLL